jgi:hypothetical protein
VSSATIMPSKGSKRKCESQLNWEFLSQYLIGVPSEDRFEPYPKKTHKMPSSPIMRPVSPMLISPMPTSIGTPDGMRPTADTPMKDAVSLEAKTKGKQPEAGSLGQAQDELNKLSIL